jgi:hypothetical protein
MNRKLTALLVVAVFLLVGGCSEKSQSVLSPIDSPSPVTSVNQGSNAKAESPEPMASIQPGKSTNCAIKLITLPQPVSKKDWDASSTSLITPGSGGQLHVSYTYLSILGKRVSVSATFTVPPGAVEKGKYVTMSLDPKYLGVKFQPGGLKFNVPAQLDFSVTGVDLSIVPIGVPISLYYVNLLTLTFEKEDASISANRWLGTIICKSG